MVQIDSKIPVGTENKTVGDAQKSAHSSSGGVFEMLFSGLSIPESEAGETLHLSEEDLQSFSVLTGMGYLNSVKGLVGATDSDDMLDSDAELSEEIPLFGLDMEALELSLPSDHNSAAHNEASPETIIGLAHIIDPLTSPAMSVGALSTATSGNGVQDVLLTPNGLSSGLLSGSFNVSALGQGALVMNSGYLPGQVSINAASADGVTMNNMALQPSTPQALLGENGLKPLSASDMAALTDEESPDILIRRVMDGMKNNIEFDVETYGKNAGLKNAGMNGEKSDLQNMLMRGTSQLANQSGQSMMVQNQALQLASQLKAGLDAADDLRPGLRDGNLSQTSSLGGSLNATSSASFAGGHSGQGGHTGQGMAQPNVFSSSGGLVSAKGELDLMQDKWTKNLAERIEKSLRDGQQEIDLVLKPKNLGKLNLRLAMNNQSLNIQIQADNQHVVSLLQDSEARLTQMLDGSGFKGAQLAFTSGFGDASGFGKRQNQSQQQDERITATSQNGLVKSSGENIMVGAEGRSSDHGKTGVDVIA